MFSLFDYWGIHYAVPTGFCFVGGVALQRFSVALRHWLIPPSEQRWKGRAGIWAIAIALCALSTSFTVFRDERLPSILGYGTIAFAIGFLFSWATKRWSRWPTMIIAGASLVEALLVGPTATFPNDMVKADVMVSPDGRYQATMWANSDFELYTLRRSSDRFNLFGSEDVAYVDSDSSDAEVKWEGSQFVLSASSAVGVSVANPRYGDVSVVLVIGGRKG